MSSKPVILELADISFAQALNALSAKPGFACIDARHASPSLARYSIIAADPASTFSMAGAFITVDGHTRIDSPHSALMRFCSQINRWKADPYLPFSCGIMGYIGFEAARALKGFEPARGFSRHPQCKLGLYDAVIIYDHAEGVSWIVANADDKAKAKARAYSLLEDLDRKDDPRRPDVDHGKIFDGVRMTPEESQFRRTLEMARSWIRSDIARRIHLVRHAASPLSETTPLKNFIGRSGDDSVGAFFTHEGADYSFSSRDALISIEGATLESKLFLDAEHSIQRKDMTKLLDEEVRKTLSSICNDESVISAKLDEENALRFTGTLDRSLAPMDAVIGMLPSHTATGTPYARVLDFIGQNEQEHRAFYGGAFGTMDSARCIFRTIEKSMTYADGTVGTTAGIDMDETSDTDEVARRMCEALSSI